MSSKLNELEAIKEEYIKKIKIKGEMSLEDAKKLRNFDYQIYMEKHPFMKKFNNWLYPESSKNDWKNILKGIVRRIAVTPVTVGYNVSLEMAANHWEKKNIEQYAPNKENKKKLRVKRWMNVFGLASMAAVEMSKVYNYKEQKQDEKFDEIKRDYKAIRNAEKLSVKRIETIMSNTAYVDNEMIRNDEADTKERIAYMKEAIEKKYKEVNPQLAALREEEKNKVEKGMDPKQAQKERRIAVKDYYNKKTQRGDY